MRILMTILLALATMPALAEVGSPVAPATQAEVNAGTVTRKYVSPAALSGWTSNGAATIGTIFVDAVSGNDTTGTGSSALPFATLTKGQSVATNGMTVYGVRGTFGDTFLGTNGVNWYFNEGVILSGSTVFVIGTNNNTTNLFVDGRATFTGGIPVYFNLSTNSTAVVRCKSIAAGNPVVSYVKSTTNTAYVTADTIVGTGVGFFDENSSASATNMVNETVFTANVLAQMNGASSSSGHSNTIVQIRAPKVLANANGYQNTPVTLITTAGLFYRNGRTFIGPQSNIVWNITALSTNDFPTNMGGIYRGTYNILR